MDGKCLSSGADMSLLSCPLSLRLVRLRRSNAQRAAIPRADSAAVCLWRFHELSSEDVDCAEALVLLTETPPPSHAQTPASLLHEWLEVIAILTVWQHPFSRKTEDGLPKGDPPPPALVGRSKRGQRFLFQPEAKAWRLMVNRRRLAANGLVTDGQSLAVVVQPSFRVSGTGDTGDFAGNV